MRIPLSEAIAEHCLPRCEIFGELEMGKLLMLFFYCCICFSILYVVCVIVVYDEVYFACLIVFALPIKLGTIVTSHFYMYMS